MENAKMHRNCCSSGRMKHSVRTREPNNVVRTVQTNPTCCDMLHRSRKQKKCWQMLGTCANIMQHCPTWCTNERNMLCPTMLGDVVPTCCVRLHGPLLSPGIKEKGFSWVLSLLVDDLLLLPKISSRGIWLPSFFRIILYNDKWLIL